MRIPSDLRIGSHHNTTNYGTVEVTNYINSNNLEVRFLNTGWSWVFTADNVRNGRLLDRMSPHVCGIGFIGVGKFNSKSEFNSENIYKRWNSMIRRCYSEKYQDKFPTYRECTVCDEWHNFQNFAEWFVLNAPENTSNCHLDKDILLNGNKVYSPSTCSFINKSINVIHGREATFSLKSPNGEVISSVNLTKFCRENNLTRSAIQMVLNGKRPHHKGWKKK